MISPELYGLVLIGGKSSRMGVDKSLISYHARDQRTHCFDLLNKSCEKVFLSCNRSQVSSITLPYIEDSNDYKGPLIGLLSAQEKFPDVAWLILACDMPFVDDSILNMLVKHRDTEAIATCFYHEFPEPLCSIWEPSSHSLLLEFVQSGNLRPRQFLKRDDVTYINIDSETKNKLRNINSPYDGVN